MSKNIELLDGGVGVFSNILPATFVDSYTYIEQLKVIADVLNQTVEVVNAMVESGGSGYILPIASKTVLGGIKIGENLTITRDGVLNAAGSEGVLSASVEQTEDGAIITITDKNGTTTAEIKNGTNADLTLGNGLIWVDGKLTLDLGENLFFTEDGKINASVSAPVVSSAIQDIVTTTTTSKGTNMLSETMTANDNIDFITYSV